MHTLTPENVAALLDDLAQLLPFPTTLYTDMGADSWAPQLYFGPVDPSSDLAAHRAGIDADTVRPVWWIDLDGGTRTILLDEVSPRRRVERRRPNRHALHRTPAITPIPLRGPAQ